jgi:hypothetical protein
VDGGEAQQARFALLVGAGRPGRREGQKSEKAD